MDDVWFTRDAVLVKMLQQCQGPLGVNRAEELDLS